MNPRRLLHTTAIRLALRYALFYMLLTSFGLGVLYWATSRYVDAQLAAGLENELMTLRQIDRQEGRSRLQQILNNRSDIDSENRRYLLLIAPDGTKLAGDLNAWPSQLYPDQRVRNIWIEDELIPHHVKDRDGYWPMIATMLPDGSRLLVAQSVQQAEDLQEFVLSAMATLLVVIIGLTLILGWRMGQQMVERMEIINNTTRRILSGDLSSRVASSGHDDEFDELATHLNQMLAHIERLINGMQEVTDNVAHDLRRPLTRLRNRLEITLLEARDEQDYRQTLEQAVADTEEMIKTFNALLEIAQAESGTYRGEWEEIDFSQLVRDVGELYQGTADNNGQKLDINIDSDIHLRGSRHLLAQSISNILENALKYSGSQSEIVLSLTTHKDQPLLVVSDTGPGIPPSEHHHVLQRFVRLDSARSTSGNGLGLSLVSAVAELHGASLALKDNSPGLRVEIAFAADTSAEDK